MPFREPLDISDYQRKVGMAYAPEPEPELPSRPVRRGWGPVVATSCTDLAVRIHIWDPNGYYYALGFRYPFEGITKTGLRLGYQSVGGENDEYATFAFKALLNKHFREMYDALEFGDPFIDKYLTAMIKGAAAKVASARRLSGEDVDQDSVMDDWGLRVVDDEGDVPSQKSEVSDPAPSVSTWDWGYYLWRSRSRDLTRLARWQQLLVAAFAARGIRQQFAVGFMGHKPHRAVHGLIEGQLALLLHEDVDPDEDLAAQMVTSSTTTGKVARELDQHGAA